MSPWLLLMLMLMLMLRAVDKTSGAACHAAA
jgi:hypothetical protein